MEWSLKIASLFLLEFILALILLFALGVMLDRDKQIATGETQETTTRRCADER